MVSTRPRQILLAFFALVLGVGIAATIASGAMRSTLLAPKLCKTVGGGRFVKIPGFPGEKIDRRLRPDVKRMVRKYDVFITDAYSTSSIHSANGEHPVGLAADIVPNKAAGGRWADIDRLAKWAEPTQNQPRPPFRWVGYDGDSNHGRGNHLHLSWNHAGTMRFGQPMRTVYSTKCPVKKRSGDGSRDGSGSGTGGSGSGTGGTSPGTGGSTGGGISPRTTSSTLFAPQMPVPANPVIETDGVGLGE